MFLQKLTETHIKNAAKTVANDVFACSWYVVANDGWFIPYGVQFLTTTDVAAYDAITNVDVTTHGGSHTCN